MRRHFRFRPECHPQSARILIGETAAHNSFASYFVSSIGVQEAMQSLTAEESVPLRLLHQTCEVHTNTSRYNHRYPLSRG